MTTREAIEDFLSQKRLAVVGVSRETKDFSRAVFRELRDRGYDVVPVNPQVNQIEGRRSFARLQDVQPPVDGALLMTAPAITGEVVRDCAEAGIRRVWMHRGAGRGAVSPAALDFCEVAGIQVIPGECPFMFLPMTGFVHRLHGFFRKMLKRDSR